MVRHSSARWPAVLGVVCVVLGGCASGGDDVEDPRSLEQIADEARAHGYDWQADLLEDGDITVAEYDEGHRRDLECLTAAGITYTEPERDLLDGFRWSYDLSWAGLDDETATSVASECSERNDMYLELAMSTWGEWDTEPTVLADLAQCVQDKGFEIEAGARNYREVWLSASDQGLTYEQVSACVAQAMQRLHPGVGYGLGF